MALMYSLGDLAPMPDCAIFADTQAEPDNVYEWLKWLELRLPFPVYRVTRGSLADAAAKVKTTRDGLRRYIQTAIPVFLSDGLKKGHGQRHCTRDYKIAPITAKLRQLLGKRRITGSDGILVEMAIGISIDEYQRVKPSRETWIKHAYPLVDKRISRQNCLEWMRGHSYPEPPRSACTFCPFHSNEEWMRLLARDPNAFLEAAKFEKRLQRAYSQTVMNSVPYLHSSRVPLDKVEFNFVMGNADLFARNECEGMCGV